MEFDRRQSCWFSDTMFRSCEEFPIYNTRKDCKLDNDKDNENQFVCYNPGKMENEVQECIKSTNTRI